MTCRGWVWILGFCRVAFVLVGLLVSYMIGVCGFVDAVCGV